MQSAKQVFEAKGSEVQQEGNPLSNSGPKKGGSFVVKAERCDVCGKNVYFSDKLAADGKIFHKSCFRCAECGSALKLGTYAALEGKFYCKPHFKQLFALKGNYAEGFGEKKPDQLWREGKGTTKPDEKQETTQAPEQSASPAEPPVRREPVSPSDTEKKWAERMEQQRLEKEKQEASAREERAAAIEAMKRQREERAAAAAGAAETTPAVGGGDVRVRMELESKVKDLEARLRELQVKEQRGEALNRENGSLKSRVKNLEEELQSVKAERRGDVQAGDREKERLQKRVRELEQTEKEVIEKGKDNEKLLQRVKGMEKQLLEERAEKRREADGGDRVKKDMEARVKRLESELRDREDRVARAERENERLKREQEEERKKEDSGNSGNIGARVRDWEGRKSQPSSSEKEMEAKVRSLQDTLKKRDAELQDLRLARPKGATTTSSSVMLVAKVLIASVLAFVVGFYAGRMVTPF